VTPTEGQSATLPVRPTAVAARAWFATPAGVCFALAVCSLTLALAYVQKDCPVAIVGQHPSAFVAQGCYSDIVDLYHFRGLDAGVFPYVHGHLQAGAPAGGAIEYPVLTGLFMWLAATISPDAGGAGEYLRVSALLLFPLGLLTTLLLTRMAGWRALLWAASPALALYAFVNWELLVVAASVIGFWLWRRGRSVWAGLAFGIGAAFKLYPILFLIPLALDRRTAGDRTAALRSAVAGLGVFALVNLPFVVAGPTGWYATYQYQSIREANYDNIWERGIPNLSPSDVNLVSGALIAALMVVALVWAARRGGRYPFLQACGAIVAALLLFSKVHSSQYALWIIPFFVLLEVRVVWWLAYSLADLARFFGTLALTDHPGLGNALVSTGVWARAALLLALFVLFLRSRQATSPARQPTSRASPQPA
jgi:uncharacterized membrane protein